MLPTSARSSPEELSVSAPDSSDDPAVSAPASSDDPLSSVPAPGSFFHMAKVTPSSGSSVSPEIFLMISFVGALATFRDSVTTGVSCPAYSSSTSSGSSGRAYPSGCFVSVMVYFPRYSSLLCALPSSPVVMVSTVSPFSARIVPSPVMISSAAVIVNSAPASSAPDSLSVFVMRIRPIAGVFSYLTARGSDQSLPSSIRNGRSSPRRYPEGALISRK